MTEFEAPTSADDQLKELAKEKDSMGANQRTDSEEAERDPPTFGGLAVKKISRPIAKTKAEKAEEAAEMTRLAAGEDEEVT